MPRIITVLALLLLLAPRAWASDPRVGIYTDLAGQSQQVTVTPLVSHQVYALALDYPPFRGYGLGILADPDVVVTGITPYGGIVDGCGPVPDLVDLHCGSAVCIDDPSPVGLVVVTFLLLQDAADLRVCAAAPATSTLDPPTPYYTPCSPVNSYPADLASSPYGDGCAKITTGSVATTTLDWGSLKGRFE